RVVPGLRRVVEELAVGAPDDLLERLVLELAALHELVQLVDIGLVVLTVMELQGFARDVGLERVERVRQRGKCVFHVGIPPTWIDANPMPPGPEARGRDGNLLRTPQL